MSTDVNIELTDFFLTKAWTQSSLHDSNTLVNSKLQQSIESKWEQIQSFFKVNYSDNISHDISSYVPCPFRTLLSTTSYPLYLCFLNMLIWTSRHILIIPNNNYSSRICQTFFRWHSLFQFNSLIDELLRNFKVLVGE